MIFPYNIKVHLEIASVRKVDTRQKEALYNVTMLINGPSRVVVLLAPANNNISFELFGFNDAQLNPSDQNVLSEQRPHNFLQFIQGVNPR